MISICRELDVLSAAKTWYINPGFDCRIIDAYTVTETAITTGNSVITISDGTTDVGAITIGFTGSAAGDIDQITFDSTSLGKVKFTKATAIKIVCGALPDAGKAELTLVLDEYHGA